MVRIAQLVRASDCGSEGRGFESHFSPVRLSVKAAFFLFLFGIKYKSFESKQRESVRKFCFDVCTGCFYGIVYNAKKALLFKVKPFNIQWINCGSGGIRTPGTVTRTSV